MSLSVTEKAVGNFYCLPFSDVIFQGNSGSKECFYYKIYWNLPTAVSEQDLGTD